MYSHLPKRVMRQFRYKHCIPRAPTVSAPPIVTHRNVDIIFEAFYYQLVPTNVRRVISSALECSIQLHRIVL